MCRAPAPGLGAAGGFAARGEHAPCSSPLHRFLASVLKLDNYRFDARQAILLDYASYALE